MTEGKKERLAKRIAAAGICSRRDAEKLIEQGLVKVNGEKVTTPAFTVSDKDIVEVRGEKLEEKSPTRLWLYNKPKGLITSHNDEKARDTVFDSLPADMPRVISVGRLDYNSEGLLLLTNSGELARMLELPANGFLRTYRARVFGTPTAEVLAKIKKGTEIEGVKYKGADVAVETATSSNAWLLITLKEGKNREIRKVFEHFGHPVSRLIRVGYGPFSLGKLNVGSVNEVPFLKVKQLMAKKK